MAEQAMGTMFKRLHAWSGAALASWVLAGCGGYGYLPPPPPEAPDVNASPLMVEADPPGHEFESSTIVRLRPVEGMDVDIFYTLDGSPATDEHAKRYEGALEIESTTLLNYIAKSATSWSTPGSELYVAMRPTVEAQDAKRTFRSDPDSIFFAWQPGDPAIMRETITLTANGVEPIRIASIRLGAIPSGQFFFEYGAFTLSEVPGPTTLAPGESLSFEVSYAPTATLRSAAIMVESDSDKNEGKTLIEVWGRVSAW